MKRPLRSENGVGPSGFSWGGGSVESKKRLGRQRRRGPRMCGRGDNRPGWYGNREKVEKPEKEKEIEGAIKAGGRRMQEDARA